MVTTMFCGPAATFVGVITLSCMTPETKLGASPAKLKLAGTPPTVTEIGSSGVQPVVGSIKNGACHANNRFRIELIRDAHARSRRVVVRIAVITSRGDPFEEAFQARLWLRCVGIEIADRAKLLSVGRGVFVPEPKVERELGIHFEIILNVDVM